MILRAWRPDLRSPTGVSSLTIGDAADADQQELGTVEIGRPIRELFDLRWRRSPLVEVLEGETSALKAGDVRRDRAVMLDDARRQPICRSRTFDEVIVEQPGHASSLVSDEARVQRCCVDRV